ncbi:uncharacterized protein K02A2.6-like [Temnothorax curvispinosus]|uniref:Uncharacterized protein K02A2.6-like n=1 Tax=Temnothorax curvispinosus TaxID=300111 RepID=A0A6J1RG06_9HYME|nr:uncharacterized protein K02A2.6-like [Temnothorax curvispinosus]
MGDASARGISPMRMSGNVAENWQMRRSRFENYLKASEVSKKPQETQCAQLLHYIGKEGFKIYKTVTLSENERDRLPILLDKFEAHFLPKENLSYERYVFFTMRQKGGQSLEQFVVELTEQAQKCKLGDLQNSLIKCMITCGVNSNEMREKLLQDDSLMLEQAIHQCKVMEKAKIQSKKMEATGEATGTVDLIKSQKKLGQIQAGGGKSVYKAKEKDKDEKKVDTLTSQDNEEYLFIGAIENNSEKHVWLTELEINEKRIKFKVDTGAMCNVMSVEHLKSLRLGNIRVKPTDTMLKSYTAILGLSSCLELNIIKKLESINDSNTYEDLVKEYKEIFSGIGCFSKPYHIKLKENAQPVIHPTCRVALSLLPKLKECLDELVKLKIIEKVEEATDWVNPLVITRKPNGSLRICLDPKDLNNNIKREQLIKTLDEITAKLNGAKVFSTSLRMPYGLISAPEVFQEKFRQTFENCESCEQYIDDVIVWGKNKAEHDERLRKVLETAKRNKVKFNLSKCQFGKSNVKYMGHIISAEGVALDESKVTAIKELQTPKCKEDVQHVLEMLTYVMNSESEATLMEYLVRCNNMYFGLSAKETLVV